MLRNLFIKITFIYQEAQITKVARLLFFHLCQVRKLASYLSHHDLATVIHVMVTSILDYCDSLCVGPPLRLTQKLHLIQIAEAWVLTGFLQMPHSQPALCELYWLPVEYWMRFMVTILSFKPLNSQGSIYLQDCLSRYTHPQRALCWWESSDSPQFKRYLAVFDPGRGVFSIGAILVEFSTRQHPCLVGLNAGYARQRHSTEHLIEESKSVPSGWHVFLFSLPPCRQWHTLAD